MYRVINETIKNGNLYAIATELNKYYLWINKKIVATIDADDDKRVKQLLDFMNEITCPICYHGTRNCYEHNNLAY